MHSIVIATKTPQTLDASLKQDPDLDCQWFEEAENLTIPADIAAKAEILFCALPPANIDAMKNLRWMQIASVGYNHLLPFKFGSRGVTVTNARGVFDSPISEWCASMMINLLRDVRGMIRNQDSGIWDRDFRFQREIRGLTVGLWGYGGIGRETARLAKALGMRVHVLNRSGKGTREACYMVAGTGDPAGTLPDRYYSPEERMPFLQSLDFLIISTPLTPATEGMIGEAELRALPQGAYLLNPARGPIIQQDALLSVLRDGHLGGAALDTHYAYPMPADHPLWKFPNVIMTPHISGSNGSPHFTSRLGEIFSENLKRFRASQSLLNHVSAEDLG